MICYWRFFHSVPSSLPLVRSFIIHYSAKNSKLTNAVLASSKSSIAKWIWMVLRAFSLQMINTNSTYYSLEAKVSFCHYWKEEGNFCCFFFLLLFILFFSAHFSIAARKMNDGFCYLSINVISIKCRQVNRKEIIKTNDASIFIFFSFFYLFTFLCYFSISNINFISFYVNNTIFHRLNIMAHSPYGRGNFFPL